MGAESGTCCSGAGSRPDQRQAAVNPVPCAPFPLGGDGEAGLPGSYLPAQGPLRWMAAARISSWDSPSCHVREAGLAV